MNPFPVNFPSNYTFVFLWVASSERLQSKTTLLKTRKAYKNQEELLICVLQNGCSKIGRSLGESLSQSPVLETLSCNFIKKQGWTADIFFGKFRLFLVKQFHKTSLNDWLERVLICLVSQIIIASAGQMLKCVRKSTVIVFRILVNLISL